MRRWIDRPRWKRKLDALKLWCKLKIRRQRYVTHDIMDGANGIFEFKYVGPDFTIFRVTLATTRGDYLDHCCDVARQQSDRKLFQRTMTFFDCLHETSDGDFEYIDPYPELTAYEYRVHAREIMRVINSKQYPINMYRMEVCPEFEDSIGIRARIPSQFITEQDVFDFMEQFKQQRLELYLQLQDQQFCQDAETLGVELSKSEQFVVWKDGWRHNDVGVDLELL